MFKWLRRKKKPEVVIIPFTGGHDQEVMSLHNRLYELISDGSDFLLLVIDNTGNYDPLIIDGITNTESAYTNISDIYDYISLCQSDKVLEMNRHSLPAMEDLKLREDVKLVNHVYQYQVLGVVNPVGIRLLPMHGKGVGVKKSVTTTDATKEELDFRKKNEEALMKQARRVGENLAKKRANEALDGDVLKK